MNSPESDNNKPENVAKPEDKAPVAADKAETNAEASAPGGSSARTWIRWGVAGAVVVAGGVVACTLLAPKLASTAARARMQNAGLENYDLKVDSAGPFFARIHDLSFSTSGGAVKVSGVNAMIDYSPLAAVGGGSLDDAIVENARVDVDLKALAGASADNVSVGKLPFALPVAMDSLPVSGLLVRGAEVNVISGGEKRTMKVDALARILAKGNRSATISATGDNGDQILVTLQPKKGGSGETINAEGSVDPLGWYIALAEALGKNLPQEVGLEAAPLVVQFAADIEGGKPGKWVWVVSQPWFQINNGPVIVSAQDARAGFTGDGGKLVKASAEGDLFLNAGNLTVGPFHTTAKIDDAGILEVNAQKVVMKGSECSMTLDYCKFATPASGEEGDLSLKGVVKPSWLPAELAANVTFSDNLDGMFVNMSLPRTALKDVTLPNGWLPDYMNGMKISGGIDADLYASVGGLAAGGFAASGRISSDNASFVIPVEKGSEIAFTGVRMRNARFSSSSKGFSIDIPDGFMAEKVKFGSLQISDFQLWPGRVSIPGDASLDSATANVFGGRLVVGGMQGKFSSTGVFVPSSPFEVKLSDADLALVAQQIEGIKMSGQIAVAAKLSPVVDSKGNLRLGVKSAVESDAFTAEYPGAFSISAKNLDANFEFDNVSDKSGTRARLEFSDNLLVNSFEVSGLSYKGKAYVGGWAETSAADIIASLVRGPFFAAKADASVRFEGGDLNLPELGVTLGEVKGRVKAELGSDSPAIYSDGALSAASASVGTLKLAKAETAFKVTPAGLAVGELSGEFCGGSLKLVKFLKEGKGYAFSVALEGVSAVSLAEVFPQFKSRGADVLDGELGFYMEKGTLSVRSDGLRARGVSPDVSAK
jgi:hypothetical protein